MNGTETKIKKHVYHDYGAPENVYDEYELSEEDQILKELNAKYSKKGAYVILLLVTTRLTSLERGNQLCSILYPPLGL